jgi:predicted DNA-binding transcriptional regulator YafY
MGTRWQTNQTSPVRFEIYSGPVRAARVLTMLLVLQRRGRLTAGELSAVLEVSERTILRDVEALGEAGVPIYTSRGPAGGIALMDGFETRLTGLTPEEAGCLFLVGQPQVAHRLGLGAPTRSARSKLDNAIPAALAEQADSLPSWFLHDPDPWTGHRIPHGELRRIARGIRGGRRIELQLAGDRPVVVSPLGLVLKAGSWHLVVADGGPASVICLDELRATRLTRQRFEAIPGFSLSEFWAARLAAGRYG